MKTNCESKCDLCDYILAIAQLSLIECTADSCANEESWTQSQGECTHQTWGRVHLHEYEYDYIDEYGYEYNAKI